MLKNQVRFLWQYLSPYKFSVGLGFLFVIFSTALEYSIPYILKLIIDRINAPFVMKDLYPHFLLLLGATLVSAVFLFWLRYLVIIASRKAEYVMRNALFSKLQMQPKPFFNQNPIGDIMSRATNDLEQVRNLIGPGFLHIFRMGLALLYTGLSLFLISPQLALVGLSLAFLLPFLSLRYMRKNYAVYSDLQDSLSKINIFVQESFSGIAIIKSLGRENSVIQKFTQKSENYRQFSRKAVVRTSLIWPVITLVSSLGICAAIFFGTKLIAAGSISLGDLSATVLYLVKVQFPLVGMGWVLNMIQRGRAALARIMTLDEKMNANTQYSIAILPTDTRPHFTSLTIQNGWFSYNTTMNPAIQNISLSLSKGQSLGIVGPTGSGKSTLAMVLAGMYRLDKGSYTINQVNTQTLNSANIMAYYSFAPQDGFLFSDSIKNNIVMGAPNSYSPTHSPQPLQRAVQQSCLEQDLPQITNGLEALLGEKGINLSGGQRQRTSLSRALLANAPILILDDTLSAVDTETEHKIVNNLRTALSHITSIIISHRYSAVTHCDEIIYLENGVIIERGTHQQLLQKQGHYARVWDMQQLSEELQKS
jgi:ATP-binding cassette, subfamily B, multidrug efflux pump